MAFFDKNSSVEDYKLRSKRLVIPFSITGNATPASKVNSNDLPASVVLSLEGQTATAAAIDSGCNFTTEVDADGVFGILVYHLGIVDKVLDARVVQLSGATTAAVTLVGASSTGVTASSNIAISVDSDADLSMGDLSGNLILDYRVSKA